MKTVLPVIALTFALATWSAPQALADDSSTSTTTTTSSDTTTPHKHHHKKKCCHMKDKGDESTNSAPAEQQ